MESAAERIEQLNIVLANTYALLVKTQNYHWNVTGPQFSSLHAMFEAQYTDLFQAIDVLAERVRALGAHVAASLNLYDQVSSIQDGNAQADAATMVSELTADHQTMVGLLTAALKVAQVDGDEVTINVLVDRMEVHEKTHWMLSSSL